MAETFTKGIDERSVLCEDVTVCGHGSVVEHVLAKDETGVRFSLPAPKRDSKTTLQVCTTLCILGIKDKRLLRQSMK